MNFSLRMQVIVLLTISCFQIANSFPGSSSVEIFYSWSPITYADLPQSENAQVDGNNYYIGKNVIPSSISYHEATGCLFFGMERDHPGLPTTINYVNTANYPKGSSPPFRGFPTYVDNYLPGWFGVNDLGAYDSDIYAEDIYARKHVVKREVAEDVLAKSLSEDKLVNEAQTEDEKNTMENQNLEIKKDFNMEKEIGAESQGNEDDYEGRKKHGSHKNPSYSHGSHHGGSDVVYVPQKKPITTTTTPNPYTRDVYHFISVYYTSMNQQCSRLFLIDHGSIIYPGKQTTYRRPSIWAFDIYECSEEGFGYPPALKVTIPENVADAPYGDAILIVDIYGDCSEFYIYISHSYDNRLIVFDNKKRSFWYFEHDSFKPQTGLGIPYNIGLFGIVLGASKGSYKEFYYSAGTSYDLYKTSTKILQNKSLAPGTTSQAFKLIGYGGQEAESIMAYDSDTQVLFFIYALSNSLQCWNTNRPMKLGSVATLFTDLEFGSDILIDGNRNLRFTFYDGHGVPYFGGEEIPSVPLINLYIVSIDKIIKGTICDPNYN